MVKQTRMTQSDLRRVERCAAAWQDARADLERAIQAARASGETYRDIAKAAGLSYQRVWQLLNRD